MWHKAVTRVRRMFGLPVHYRLKAKTIHIRTYTGRGWQWQAALDDMLNRVRGR